MARIVSSERFEIRLPLTDQQWQAVADTPGGLVKLMSKGGKDHWQGYVLRKESHVNEANRQRAIVVAVDKPLEQTPPLYAGTFVTAQLLTVVLDSSVRLPASALSSSGHIWYVDDNDQLARFIPKATYAFDNQIVAQLPEGYGPGKFVERPLSSYTPGLKVQPVVAP